MFYKTSPNEKGAKSVFTDMADFFLFFSPLNGRSHCAPTIIFQRYLNIKLDKEINVPFSSATSIQDFSAN
jgi:hypothetical protein